MASTTKRRRRGAEQAPPPDERAEPLEGLSDTAAHQARIVALLALGLTVDELADAFEVAVSTVRNWQDGKGDPRAKAKRLVDDLRLAAVILSEAGLEGPEVGQWLRSRNRDALENQRPLELIASDPLRVLAACEAFLLRKTLERDDESRIALVPDET